MTLLHAELRKLVTLPSLRLTALLTLLASLLLIYLEAPRPLRYVQAGFLVLGVLAAASEHQGGDQIRATLLAMPRRLRLYAAKVAALAVVAAPVALLASAPDAGYLVLTALLGGAAGTLIRRAETAAVLVLVVYFIVCPLLRGRFSYLPDHAASGAPAVWAACAVTLAGYVFHRRDA